MTTFHAFVDETGDRGSSESASPVFGMAAVLVAEADRLGLVNAVRLLRHDFGVPDGVTMSWKNHLKTHDRRRRAAEVLAAVPGLQVCFVYAEKAALRVGTYRNHPTVFYNYVAYKMYKSVVWAARHGGATELRLRFGHVRHHDHTTTKDYIKTQATQDPKVPDYLVDSLRWVSADRYLESQAADIFGGFLKAAMWPSGEFGYVEPTYLLTVWPVIRNSGTCVIPLGLMCMPADEHLTSKPWFPCSECRRRER